MQRDLMAALVVTAIAIPESLAFAAIVGLPLQTGLYCALLAPIVYALLEKGLPLGTALAFMMAVSAISLPEMIILRRVLKIQLVMVFAGILAVAVIATGYLFNLVV